ncbi:tRNA-dihydrouridine synthase family protein [bacterium]|nr:tRNA-dihydrouridine synthase family protein [bacterium]
MKINLFENDQKPVFLAPMEGVSNSAFRKVVSKNGGIDVVCTEFIRVTQGNFSPKKLKLAKLDGIFLSVQLMGNEPEHFCESAKFLSENGADLIDLNLGCPSKKVNSNGSGAALLENPLKLAKIVEAIRKAIPDLTFSVKIRAGEKLPEILTIIESEGVDFITVHPRTKTQCYEGLAKREVIAFVKNFVKIPVVGNGDITSPESAKEMFKTTNCDGIMIGRGVLKNPLLFREVKDFLAFGTYQKAKVSDCATVILELGEELKNIGFSENAICGRIKEFSGFFCQTLKDGVKFKTKIAKSQNLQGIFDVYKKICEEGVFL